MTVPSWRWGEVPQSSPWNPAAWRLLNQRMTQLQQVLEGLRGITLEHVVIPDGETEPLVARRGGVTIQNASAATVVRFRGGEIGQRLVVRAGDSVSTLAHSPILRLSGNSDWSLVEGETRSFWTPDGVVWYEVPRDIAAADPGWILTNAGIPITDNDGDYLARGE